MDQQNRPCRSSRSAPLTRASLVGALFASSLLFALPAVGQTSGEESTDETSGAEESEETERSVRERLAFHLKAYGGAPKEETLKELGDDAKVADLLVEIAEDSSQRVSVRLRAVDVMRYFEEPAVVAYLEDKLQPVEDVEEAELDTFRRKVAHSAMNSLAKLQGDASLSVLSDYLASDELQLKLTAISAIGAFGGEAGAKKLQELRRRTDDEAVLRAIERQFE